jgi:acyl-CoA dehydrogenase
MYAHTRTVRIVDGPDEVHKRTIARHELRKYKDRAQAVAGSAAQPLAEVSR